MKPEQAFVALLRGINVGGRNRLAMKDLTTIVSRLGCSHVTTFIQSGNVVFRTTEARTRTLAEDLSTAIEAHAGFQVPVVLRSCEEMEKTLLASPFPGETLLPQSLHFGFLAVEPTAEARARLDPARSPTDRFVVVGREIFLHCPHGLGRTKLTNEYFDRTLGTVSTVRNHATTSKLTEMLQALRAE